MPKSRAMPGSPKAGGEDGLRGRTLAVYVWLVRHQEAGVREIQKELGFSSPSVAFRHLDKLVEMGVAEKHENDRYALARKVDSGSLLPFVSLAGLTFPRLGFYAILFSAVAAGYVLLNLRVLNLYALIGTVGTAAALWYEALRAWRRSPFR